MESQIITVKIETFESQQNESKLMEKHSSNRNIGSIRRKEGEKEKE